VLDLGAGTGVAGDAARAAGAERVVALDAALGVLSAGTSPAAVAGDAVALPFRTGSFDAVVAAFSLNHLDDPAAGLREAARIGGAIVAGAYAADDAHPVKGAVEDAAVARGWTAPPWHEWVRSRAVPALATVDGARSVLAAAKLDGDVEHVEVDLADLTAEQLVAWRLGMAQLAPFVAGLAPAARDALVADALDRLGRDPPPLVRRIVVLACGG
jgi:SAM-dependent methyltransferase